MRKILQLLTFLTTSVLFAQFPPTMMKSSKKISKFDKYAGSIYVFEDYKQADVINESSGTFEAELNYNIYTDALEFTEDSKLFQLVKTPTTHARIDGDYYYFCNFKTQRGVRKDGYFVLVELNDLYRIYKRYELKITDPEDMNSMGTSTIGKIKVLKTLYLEENGIILELPMSKKGILSAFSDKQDELKKYIKKEKIKLKKEEDLIRLVAKYNALKSIDASPTRSLLGNTDQNN
ncbi:hypothetical protein [Aquimarina sp. MMG016]|uniref:hypothetical protein n=1 Tax=Aquimarina sp. MMG016 TaxID=2822690 RepID=UPI001B39E056|nr:hypothetical protein [Aquimarina sp. MMG016]MBQ4818664.1 hypothetical protein [Aquimarina sp. MMG016]